MKNLPQSEIEAMLQSIRAHPEYGDPEYVTNAYRSQGLKVIPEPLFSADIITGIKQALLAKKGLSVIRIGDGEMNLMSYGAYAHRPIWMITSLKRFLPSNRMRLKWTLSG